MPLSPCSRVFDCCGGSPCCPDTFIGPTLTATITSSCAALNGTVTLNRVGDTFTWTGDLTISGCNDCTILRVTVECDDTFHTWSLTWVILRSDGTTLCSIIVDDTNVTTENVDCGPPFSATTTSTALFLFDDVGLCCGPFSITADVEP